MSLNIINIITGLFNTKEDNTAGLQALLREAEHEKTVFSDVAPVAIDLQGLRLSDFPKGLSAVIGDYIELDTFETSYDDVRRLWIGLSYEGIEANPQNISNPYLREIVQKLQDRYFIRNEDVPKYVEKKVWRSQQKLAETLKEKGVAVIKHHHYLYRQTLADIMSLDKDESNVVNDVITSFTDSGDITLETLAHHELQEKSSADEQ